MSEAKFNERWLRDIQSDEAWRRDFEKEIEKFQMPETGFLRPSLRFSDDTLDIPPLQKLPLAEDILNRLIADAYKIPAPLLEETTASANQKPPQLSYDYLKGMMQMLERRKKIDEDLSPEQIAAALQFLGIDPGDDPVITLKTLYREKDGIKPNGQLTCRDCGTTSDTGWITEDGSSLCDDCWGGIVNEK